MFKNADINFLIKIFDFFSDEIYITDFNGNIVYKNQSAQNVTQNIKNITNLSHQFDFEICILKSEDILSYTPIYAALESKESFCATVSRQIKNKLFEEYILSTFIINEKHKLFIITNTNKTISIEKYEMQEHRINELEEQISNSIDLKHKLENHLLRTNLTNLVSEKVSEFIDTKKILKIVFEQIKKTIEIDKIEFADEYNDKKIKQSINHSENISILTIPIHRNTKIFGAINLYRKDMHSTWQKEEIDLIKNLTPILATAFLKEELFEQLKAQKSELENALKKLKNAQLQIVQSEKLATLGQLVAGVAHEINTPLGAIASNLDLLEKMSNKKFDTKEIIKEIYPVNKEAIRRIENLVKSLKNFTRLDEAKKKKVDITEGLLSSINLIGYETKNKLNITTNFIKLPQISCYPDYINQVFMNILLNACQSIKSNGNIHLKTEIKNDYAIISISDNGCGIEKKYLDKIFDFGFTTKKIGQGTGLGLALAKKIIDEHKGKIEVESAINKGTTFKIYLPI